MTYHQYCFFLPISAFFIPQTRETHAAQWQRMYIADWTEWFLNVLKHEIQRTRLAGSIKQSEALP
jgi:hypothetical protein